MFFCFGAQVNTCAIVRKLTSVDPLAAKYPFYTPYNYAGNKPINKIDIDGMQEGNKGGGGTPIAAPTGGNTAVPSGNSSSGGCMTCPPITAVSKPDANTVANRLPVATTSNGPGNGQQFQNAPVEKKAPPGNYYPGLMQTSGDANLKSVSNLNTTNVARTIKLGEPTDNEYMQMAADKLYSGGASASYLSLGVNTQGDISTGFGESSNSTINIMDGELISLGTSGVMVSPTSLSTDVPRFDKVSINIANESSNNSNSPYITHDQSGAVTGTVQVDFNIENKSASFGIGAFKSTVTAVRNFTPTYGPVQTRTIGTISTTGATIGGKLPNGLGLSIDFNIK